MKGASVIDKVIDSVIGRQVPWAVVVIESTTDPLVVSVAEGM